MYDPAANQPAEAPITEAAPYPVIRRPLEPFEVPDDALTYGWREMLPFGGTVLRPRVCVAVLAPVDSSRKARIAEMGVGGLARDVAERAAALPVVAKVRTLREQLAASLHRVDQASAAIAEAESRVAASLQADEVDGPTLYAAANHAKAVAAANHAKAQAEAASLRTQLATAVPVADAALRAFARSAAELLHRQRRQELLEAIEQLPGEVFESIITLHTAASELAAGGGDRVFSEIRRGLLGDIGPENLAIQPDAVDGSVYEYPAEPILPRTGPQAVETIETPHRDGVLVTTRYIDSEPEPEPEPAQPEPLPEVDSNWIGQDRDLTEEERAAEGSFEQAGSFDSDG